MRGSSVISWVLLVVGLSFGPVNTAEKGKTTNIGILPFENQAGEEYSWLSAGISAIR